MTVRKITHFKGTEGEPYRILFVEFDDGTEVPVEEVTESEWEAIGVRIAADGSLIVIPTKLN